MHHQYTIPCPHDLGQVSTDETVPDYYPLSKGEVTDLLFIAKEAIVRNDVGTVSSIQCRFDQGVIGQVCPRKIENEVAQRTAQLNRLFVDYLQGSLPQYTDKEVVEELYQLMQG